MRALCLLVLIVCSCGKSSGTAERATPDDAGAPGTTANAAANSSAASGDYVGSKGCKKCHDEYLQRATHHMAQTSHVLSPESARRFFSDTMLARPYEAEVLPRYRRTGDRVFLEARKPRPREPRRLEVAVVIGSMKDMITPISLRRGRSIAELGVSYFVEAGYWSHSPGHHPGSIGSPETPGQSGRCLFCHASKTVWRDDGRLDLERSIFGIECERCHGSATKHVAEIMKDDTQTHIGNPKKLRNDLQVRFCAQCHNSPITASPDYVINRDYRLARMSGVGTILSECFQQSPPETTITCIECHDPHRNIDRKRDAAKFRRACLRCHDKPGPLHRNKRITAKSDCIKCHMPLRDHTPNDRPKVWYTDHWIQVQASKPPYQVPGRKKAFISFMKAELARYKKPTTFVDSWVETWRERLAKEK